MSKTPGMKQQLLLGILLAFTGCSSPSSRPPQAQGLPGLINDFIHDYHQARPLTAVALGWHQYDGHYVVPTGQELLAEQARLVQWRNRFQGFQATSLPLATQRDLAVIWRQLETDLLFYEGMRWPWRSPMFYLGNFDLSIYLKRDWKPLADRVRDMTAILQLAPSTFAAARTNLEARLPRTWIELGIQMAEGTAVFLERDVAEVARQVTPTSIAGNFAVANARAVRELRDYAGWLKSERLPLADDGFAIGPEQFNRLLRAEMVNLTPAELLELGLRELRLEQQRFAAAARLIDPIRPPADVFKLVQRDHPTAQSLLPDTRRNLESIRQFVVDHRLVTIPSDVRAKVEATLPPFRPTSFASMDTPGPFETKATEAIYYVTPTEADWTPQQQEEWLTAFNYYTTDVVSIHEAYPGHYVQFLALNASDATPAAKVFTSYAFVEGWAHHAEQMVLDAGFAGPEPLSNPPPLEQQLRAARYRLAQSSEALLRLCRLCCAVKLHCGGMTVDEAARFFVDNAYYEPQPARAEAIRGTFDPGYCFYTVGKLQLLKLRRDLEAQDGASFSEQRFHDQVLSHGAPPIRILRQALLQDPSQWDRDL